MYGLGGYVVKYITCIGELMKSVSDTFYGGLLHMSVYMIDAQIIGHRVISIAWWTHWKGYVKYQHCTELTDKLFGCGCRVIG